MWHVPMDCALYNRRIISNGCVQRRSLPSMELDQCHRCERSCMPLRSWKATIFLANLEDVHVVPMPLPEHGGSTEDMCFTGPMQVQWIGQLLKRPQQFVVLHADGKHKLGSCIRWVLIDAWHPLPAIQRKSAYGMGPQVSPFSTAAAPWGVMGRDDLGHFFSLGGTRSRVHYKDPDGPCAHDGARGPFRLS